jgi:ABC-type transport system involved in multi-copper enzyme maturation permease subunit
MGSICILCSAYFRSSFRALLASYSIVLPVGLVGLLIPGFFLISPAAFMLHVEGKLGAGELHIFFWGPGSVSGGGELGLLFQGELVVWLMVYTYIHWAIVHVCLHFAWRCLRTTARKPTRRVLCPSGPGERGVDSVLSNIHIGTRHPVTDAPLLWKEVYHGARFWANLPLGGQFLLWSGIGLAIVLPILALIGLITGPNDNSSWLRWDENSFAARTLNPEIRILAALLAGMWCLSVAWRACRSVSLEREQQTLDSLLTLPLDRSAILRAKWWGSMLRFRWLVVLLLSVYLGSILYGAFHWTAGFIVTAACVIHAAFLASLGIYLSLWCRNTLRANLAMAAVLGLMVFGTAAAAAYRPLFFDTVGVSWWDNFVRYGLNPVRAWQFLPMDWGEFKMEFFGAPGLLNGKLGAAFAGLCVYAILAAVFWIAARRRFVRS